MPAGAHRRVLAGAERLLAATTTAVAAGAVAHDAVTRPIGKAGIGEGLAITAAPGADRLVLLGAELRIRARRARPRSFIDDDVQAARIADRNRMVKPCREKIAARNLMIVSPPIPVSVHTAQDCLAVR